MQALDGRGLYSQIEFEFRFNLRMRMPEGVTKQPRKAGKREAILAAARGIVSEVGFHETSIAAVASAAGVSTGSVYSYFASKAELMAEIVAVV